MDNDFAARVLAHEIVMTHLVKQICRLDPALLAEWRGLPAAMEQVLREQRIRISESSVAHAMQPEVLRKILDDLVEAADSEG